MTVCTYTFNGPDGKETTLRGMEQIKAFLANGGLEHFYPNKAFPWHQTAVANAVQNGGSTNLQGASNGAASQVSPATGAGVAGAPQSSVQGVPGGNENGNSLQPAVPANLQHASRSASGNLQAAGEQAPVLKQAKTAPLGVFRRIKQFVQKQYGAEIAPRNPSQPVNDVEQAASALAEMNGKTLTFVENIGNTGSGFNGLMDQMGGKHLFINTSDHDDAPLFVAVHEITHGMPEHIRTKFEQGVMALARPGAEQAFVAEFDYTPSEVRIELPSMVAQAISKRPTFWEELRQQMGNKDFAELAKFILQRLKNFLSNVAEGYGEDFLAKYLTDVQAAQQLLVQAYVESMREQALEADASLTGGPVASKPRGEMVGDYRVTSAKDGSITVHGEPAAIRALLPDGVIGRATKDGLVFSHTMAQRVRASLDGKNLTYSRGGQVVEKLPMRGGKYIGAPAKFDTPAKIPTLRRILKKLALEGEPGRFWYENSSQEILKMTGGDVNEARKFVALLAIYSPQAKVDANSTFALRAWSQYKAGQPISVKTAVMDNKAMDAMRDVDKFWSGEKTGNFFFNLLRMIDPSTEGQQGATIDMWMMRAGQYSTDAPTSTQYAFMENETNRLAKELGWEPQQVQAAIWVAMKARMENAGVKKATEAVSEKRGWLRYDYPLKNGRPVKTRVVLDAQKHRDNWLRHSMAHDVTKNDTQQAKFDFSDGVRRHIGQISFEARPGRTTGVLPGIHDAPYAQQVEFQQAIHSAFLDGQGNDTLAQMLGLLVDNSGAMSPGVWQSEVSPSHQILVAMAPAKGDDGKTKVDPAQAKALDLYAAVAGWIGRQEGVGWHRPFYSGTRSKENGVDLRVGRPLSPEESLQLYKAIDERMAAAGVSDWGDKSAMVSTPEGMRVVNFGALEDNKSFRTLVEDAVSDTDFDAHAVSFTSDGNLVTNNWKENPNGQDFVKQISDAGRPDLLEWARTVLAPKVQAVYNDFSSRYGWGDPGQPLASRQRAGDGSRRDQGRSIAPLPGAPLVEGATGPDPRLVTVAEQYARDNGIDLRRQAEYVKVDPERAARIAQAYEAMPHEPQNPRVKEAFQNLIRQTVDQYRALEKAGYKFYLFDETNDPYDGNPWNAMRDLRANQTMGVFATEAGFGSGATELNVDDNPLLADTGIQWPYGSLDGEPKRVLANDLFRAVHDAFGHGLEGTGFRAQGEENAWQAHIRLFTGSAKGAITSETRGQNSWLNYGPHGEANQKAKVEDTVFADQKTGLMPEWTWTEGLVDDMQDGPVASNKRRDDVSPLGLYSELARQFDASVMKQGTSESWKQAIQGMVNKGKVKADEVTWSGILDWLDMQDGKVTKEQVQDYLRQGGVQVQETQLGGDKTADVRRNIEREFAQEGYRVDFDTTGEEGYFTDPDGNEIEFDDLPENLQEAVVKASDQEMDAKQAATKYESYTLPGGENYREVLLTLPTRYRQFEARYVPESTSGTPGYWAVAPTDATNVGQGFGRYADKESAEREARRRSKIAASPMQQQLAPGQYSSSHWDQLNVLAHIRTTDRTDADGGKVLFVEEVQSDWGQQGKKEGFDKPPMKGEVRQQDGVPGAWAVYWENGTHSGGFNTREQAEYRLRNFAQQKAGGAPLSPFVTKTEGWLNLALKRVITLAVDGGYDKVAFVNGEQSADRYDLSKSVSRIEYEPISADDGKAGTYEVMAYDMSGNQIFHEDEIGIDRVEDVLGKEIAKKIEARDGDKSRDGYRDWHTLSGLDLKVGGEGMKAFYDKIVPNAVKALLKKVGGGQLEKVGIPDSNAGREVVASQVPGERMWGVYDRQKGQWLSSWDSESYTSDPEDAELMSESTAKSISAAIMRDAGVLLEQPGFAITDAMREKAADGLPMFSLKTRLTQRTKEVVGEGSNRRAYTADQLKAMDNVGFRVEQPSLMDRFNDLIKDAGKKMAQGIADQFAPVKDMDLKAYGLMRLAKGASGAFETLLQGGKLKLTDGVYDFDEKSRGGVIETLLKPLQGEHHDFFRWIAANRAERLLAEGKENLFTPADVQALKTLATGQTDFDYTIQNGVRKGRTTRDRAEIYRDSQITFNAFNKNVLDMAEQSGLIDGDSRALWEHEFYVPFYRVADDSDGGVRGMNIKSGVVRQEAFKRLKGGKQALNADLLDNTLMNWAHLLDASAKNRAAQATLEAAVNLGAAMEAPETLARQLGGMIGKKDSVVWFMDGGVKRFFLVDDPYLMTALTGLEFAGMRGPMMDAMSTLKHALTVGVTASPFFKIRNLIRDSVQVIGSGPISYNPVKNIAEGWKLTDSKNDGYYRLLAGGGTIHFGTMLEGSEAKRVQALVESGIDESTILNSDQKVKAFYRRYIEPLMTAYNELGNRGETINRAALYDQLRAQGKSHAEASLQARDLMDFSMQGSWSSIRFLTQVVPFMNARIQGLYKLGRATKEDPARMAAVIGAASLISLGLLAAYADDDDWKKREDWDRNNYWWIKVGGTAFRIPKPFEIGAVATLAERSFELAFEKEMTGKRFREQVMTLLGDNLSMNPVPQLVKPMIDLYANKDSFSGRPIETLSMERLKSEYRFNGNTSMIARGASTAMNSVTGLVGKEALSPVQIDHLLRGYFGWLGTMVVTAGDVALRPMTDQPSKAAPDYWKQATGGMVSDLRDAPSRYVSSMYDQAKELEQAYGTWRSLIKEGKIEEAELFHEANRDDLIKYRRVEGVKRQVAQANEQARRIERSDASPEQKRESLREIRARQDTAARRLADVQ